MSHPGFFNLDERHQPLSETGDLPTNLAGLIDFEAFRLKLATALRRSDGSKGGRLIYAVGPVGATIEFMQPPASAQDH